MNVLREHKKLNGFFIKLPLVLIMSAEDTFEASLKQFGDRVVIIQCVPSSKKRSNSRSSSLLSSNNLPIFVVRFCCEQNALHIEALNLRRMYQLVLKENELSEHVLNAGFYDGCPWDRYFRTLSSVLSAPDCARNLTLQKGKGGGYLTLKLKYPVDEMSLTLTGTFQLSFVDEYCQSEEDAELPSAFKERMFYAMFAAAISQSKANNAQSASSDNDDNRNQNNRGMDRMNVEQQDDSKSENIALQRKVAALEEENMRLRASNMGNTLDVGTMDLSASMAMGGGSVGGGVLANKRKRKQRDVSKSLMNPRRKKHRTGLQLGGAKKKNLKK